jgi:hypothetical protein
VFFNIQQSIILHKIHVLKPYIRPIRPFNRYYHPFTIGIKKGIKLNLNNFYTFLCQS